MERCRKIYERQIQVFSFVSDVWIDYALFECRLAELQRARFIFEIAVAQQELDMPEHVWKAFIDFEIDQAEKAGEPVDFTNARTLYNRLLQITKHVNVWTSFAQFEADHAKDFENSRKVYQDAQAHFRDHEPDQKEDRAQILETWYTFECKSEVNALGEESEEAKAVLAKMPKKVKKRRKTETAYRPEEAEQDQEEAEEGWEEYIDLIFPED